MFKASIAAFVLFALLGCTPVRIVLPLSRQVLDSETRTPVSGATLHLGRGVVCGIVHGTGVALPPVETRTDANGRFRLPGGVLRFPCWGVADDVVDILAVGYGGRTFFSGYRDDSRDEGSRWLGSGPVLLDRIRYASEVEFFMDPTRSDDGYVRDRGPLWRESVRAFRAARINALTAPGVFQSEPGAEFDQVAVIDRWHSTNPPSTVLVHNRRDGSIQAWGVDGQAIILGLPEGGQAALAGGDYRLRRPFISVGDRIYSAASTQVAPNGQGLFFEKWYVLSSGLQQVSDVRADVDLVVTVDPSGSGLSVYKAATIENVVVVPPSAPAVASASAADLFGTDSARIECLTGSSAPVVVARVLGGYAVSVMPMLPAAPLKVVPLRLPANFPRAGITACASNGQALFVAVRGKGIRRFPLAEKEVKSESTFWGRAPLVPGGDQIPTTFTALAATQESARALVYAVAGTGVVYRFSATGLPDQRIDFETGER